jgi:hypothetical protein
MVWIHGGGFSSGGAAQSIYDGWVLGAAPRYLRSMSALASSIQLEAHPT